ncbi:MAG: exodeoxyribonuclease V subunit gamma, partial [Pontibacterium sp.]
MFTVYHSNGLDILKSLLVNRIQAEPLDDPFTQEQILVQSPGMAQWLKIELAEASGIAASIEFPLPATFLWNTFKNVLDDVPERSAFNKAAMSWRLMAILPTFLSQPAFSPLKNYLDKDEKGLKLYQLAARIADVFDQYLVYRPEWIADWETGGA